ncbi:MAG: FecR family protein, partial [bacterium]|nr:FecR family protein [bacterium]
SNTHVEIKNGRVSMVGDMRDGQRLADVSRIEYNLDFWNVGEDGGTQGIAFWKKDYGLATLTFIYNFAGAGRIVKQGPSFGDLNLPSFTFEDASGEPDIDDVVYKFRYTGGPNGSFMEVKPYKDPAGPASGQVVNGTAVVFNFPANSPHLINTTAMDFPWKIQGDPFFGYDESAGCSVNLSGIQSKNKFAFIPAAQAIDSGARFTDFSGEVTVAYPPDLEDLYPAEHDMVLGVGAHINTESNSSAIISFADMTTFCMKEFSRIILMPGDGPQSKLSLLAGKIWANVKSMVKDGSMDVTMNQAVAGIKGTTFVLEDDGSTSTIKVIDGSVEFTSKASGKTEVVNAGETITADENGLGQKTNFDVNAESNSWKNLSSNSGKAPADTKNYPYYVAGLVLLALVGLVVFLIKKKKK